jgi:hypothetical protein
VGYQVTKHQGCQIVMQGLPQLGVKKEGGSINAKDYAHLKNMKYHKHGFKLVLE